MSVMCKGSRQSASRPVAGLVHLSGLQWDAHGTPHKVQCWESSGQENGEESSDGVNNQFPDFYLLLRIQEI